MSRRRLRTVLVWNMKVGRGRAAIRGLRNLIDRHDPEVLLLQEAKNYVRAIRLTFPGWRVYGGLGFRDSSNCVVMVRRSMKRGKHGTIRNGTPWTFMHDGKPVVHAGRVWRWVRVDGVALMSIHKATNALGDNKAAGEEEAFRLVEWFEDHGGPRGAFGDFNNTAADKRDHGPSDIADRADAEVLAADDEDIDLAVIAELEATVTQVEAEGSDHHAHRYTIKESR